MKAILCHRLPDLCLSPFFLSLFCSLFSFSPSRFHLLSREVFVHIYHPFAWHICMVSSVLRDIYCGFVRLHIIWISYSHKHLGFFLIYPQVMRLYWFTLSNYVRSFNGEWWKKYPCGFTKFIISLKDEHVGVCKEENRLYDLKGWISHKASVYGKDVYFIDLIYT